MTDLDMFLDDAYEALFERLDTALPEFAFEGRGDHWVATAWPAGFPYPVQDPRPDRLVVYRNRPWYIKVHGHSGIRVLDYLNGGQKPEGTEFIEVARRLADLAGVRFPEREPSAEDLERVRKRERRREILDAAIDITQETLWSQDGASALVYLREGRGLTDDEIRDLELGYYASAEAVREALRRRGCDLQAADDAAVLWRTLEGYIIIPWRDAAGHPLTLYGRWHEKTAPEGRPKTLALPGDGTKGSPLYLDRARRAGHRDILAVEGVFDGALLQVRGETRAAAYVAAQFSALQVETMVRYRIRSVLLCGDPDGGGDRGTLANIKALTTAGIPCYVVPRLPDGLDPDEFLLRVGIDGWKAHVAKAIHAFRFIAEEIVRANMPEGGWTDIAKDNALRSALEFDVTVRERREEELLRHLWPMVIEATCSDRQAIAGMRRAARKQAEEDRKRREAVRRDTASTARGRTGTKHSGPPRVRIFYDEGHLPDTTRQAIAALQARNNPPQLFVYGNCLSRIESRTDGTPAVRPLGEHHVRHELARAAEFFEVHGDGQGGFIETPIDPPMIVVRDILATPNLPLPVLTRIVTAPVFAPDATLQTAPGYHATSRTYYAPTPGFALPPISESPTRDEMFRARNLIVDELLGDFPFEISVRKTESGGEEKIEAECAHAVALLLLPFVRDMIDGPTPLHLIEKNSPGTGASLMVDTLVRIATGHPALMMTEGRDDEEWRKRITAKLIPSPTYVVMDNLRRRLDTSAVAAAITAAVWEDRILRSSENAAIPVRCVWVATGNNPSVSSEISRRTVRIRLDAKCDRPWLRKPEEFKHPLPAWADRNRPELVAAALTLVRYWIAQGRPLGTRTLGMFESWAGVMGGILQAVEIGGFLENLQEFYESSDDEGATMRSFVGSWWGKHSDHTVGASDLFDIAMAFESIDLGDGGERSQRTRFGRILCKLRDRTFTMPTAPPDVPLVLRVEADGLSHGAKQWRLVKYVEEEDVEEF